MMKTRRRWRLEDDEDWKTIKTGRRVRLEDDEDDEDRKKKQVQMEAL